MLHYHCVTICEYLKFLKPNHISSQSTFANPTWAVCIPLHLHHSSQYHPLIYQTHRSSSFILHASTITRTPTHLPPPPPTTFLFPHLHHHPSQEGKTVPLTACQQLLGVHAVSLRNILLRLRAGVHVQGHEPRRGHPHQVVAATAGVAADAGVAVVGRAFPPTWGAPTSCGPIGSTPATSAVSRRQAEGLLWLHHGDRWARHRLAVGLSRGQMWAVGGTRGQAAAYPRAGHTLHQAGHGCVRWTLKVDAVEHLR